MLGVYNVLKQKHADVLTSDYKTSFEERLMWFEDSY